MCLLHMKVGEMACIDALNVNSELKKRLNALGFIRDTNICVKNFGLFKSTVQVLINRSFIALRKEEAMLIEVHKI
ncbi:MAG: ferrous iron transport protein A [Sulfurimonas sp.]|jgi:ferrous iron transport protein A|nr:ferrous iron transport protein A [Sulfurimonas sp.]MBU1215814.1 ferrous iron transport protein A [bacterium]MBU1435493.1 ferrous iron transport protein A [bacterium]MBU1502583.1 ferrous iron transport protein A [bacterium]MBU3939877.1 ferrous iron transport protein A [bacterium]